MNRKRLFPALFILLIAILLSGPFLVDSLLAPVATGIWFLLRLFVLSVDQGVLWAVLLYCLFVVFLVRSLRRTADPSPEQPERQAANSAMETVAFTRSYFTPQYFNPDDIRTIRQELINMLITAYASAKRISPDYTILEAFRSGEIALPGNVHLFLFPVEQRVPWYDLRGRFNLKSRRAYRKFLRDFEEILAFLEQYMETNHEHESDRSHHG